MANKEKKEEIASLEKCRGALLNALGAYDALKTVGAHDHLPGFERCKKNCDEAIEVIDDLIKEKEANE